MKLLGLTVTRNECDRYLQSCLAWHVPIFDEHLVYDDCSTDETVSVVMGEKAAYTCRPEAVPAFMEHEGRFRQDSLLALEELYQPQAGDWVMVVDTDEFLVATREQLDRAIVLAERQGAKSIRIERPELWSLDPPAERVDGFWGSIKCTRLFRWEPGGKIQDKAMGCGNEPTYINSAPIFNGVNGAFKLLHVGYVDAADRDEKYERYSSLNNHGHNNAHVESIVATPQLRPWTGDLPPIWRGIRHP